MTGTKYCRFALGLMFVLNACGSGGGGGSGDDDGGPDATLGPDAAVTSCGNGTCDPGETTTSCSADCTAPACGDGTCHDPETIASCPADCHPVCGDAACDPGETTASCPADCPAAACTVADPTSCSGETVCIAGVCENAFGRNYKITVVSAVFTEKKADGSSWDAISGLPDPKVTMTINGAKQFTPVIDNTLSPTWNFVTPPTLLPGGTVFTIEVVDADLGFDEPAWTCTLDPLTADVIRAGARCSGTGLLSTAHADLTFTPN